MKDEGSGPKKKWDSEMGFIRDEPSGDNRDFLSRNYRTFFTVSFLLLLTGVLIMAISNYPNAPDSDDYDSHDNYEKAMDTYTNIISDIQNTAELFFTLGILLLSFLFFMAPFVKIEMNNVMRIALVIVGLILVTHFLNDGFKLQVIFG